MSSYSENEPHEFSDEAFYNLDIFIDEFIEMVKGVIDDYADISKKSKKELIIKCVTPDDHPYDTNDVAFHDKVINFAYKNMRLKRQSRDTFMIYFIGVLR